VKVGKGVERRRGKGTEGVKQKRGVPWSLGAGAAEAGQGRAQAGAAGLRAPPSVAAKSEAHKDRRGEQQTQLKSTAAPHSPRHPSRRMDTRPTSLV